MRTLTINYGPGVENKPSFHGFEVVDECGRTTGQLCLGELIEQVIDMIHPSLGKVRYQMLTPEQWEQRWAKSREHSQAIQMFEPPVFEETAKPLQHGDMEAA